MRLSHNVEHDVRIWQVLLWLRDEFAHLINAAATTGGRGAHHARVASIHVLQERYSIPQDMVPPQSDMLHGPQSEEEREDEEVGQE